MKRRISALVPVVTFGVIVAGCSSGESDFSTEDRSACLDLRLAYPNGVPASWEYQGDGYGNADGEGLEDFRHSIFTDVLTPAWTSANQLRLSKNKGLAELAFNTQEIFERERDDFASSTDSTGMASAWTTFQDVADELVQECVKLTD